MRKLLDLIARVATNLFIIATIVFISVDTLPLGDSHFKNWSIHQPIKEARVALRQKVLNPLGLWQGIWALFCPDPVRYSEWLSADLTFPDGQQKTWMSMNFTEMDFWEWKRQNRMINYVQYLQDKTMIKARVFLPLVAHLAETETLPDSQGDPQFPSRIVLYSNEKEVKSPPDTTERALMVIDQPELSLKNSWFLGKPLVKRWKDVKTSVVWSWERPKP